MQSPSDANPSDSPSANGSGARTSAVRRYGPIAAIGVVVAVIAAVSVATIGGDDDDHADEDADDLTATTGDLPEGAISWSIAQEEGLDVTFPETCDTEAGMVAIPFFFRTECFADVDDNGGATAVGVTEDEIDVVAWVPDDADLIMAVAKAAFGSDATGDDIRQTYEGLVEIFNTYYQTYGRSVNLEFAQASGDAADPVRARSDAVEAAEREPFAVLGGPLATSSWTEELHARGIVCVVCLGIRDPDPTVFTITPSQGQISEHVTNYISAKLAGEPAEFAGGDLADQERVFGILTLGLNPDDELNLEDFQQDLSDAGIEVASTFSYELDLGGAQEVATSFVSQFQEAGVTTVIAQTPDPITMADITDEATIQDWFPEWLLPGIQFINTNAFARNFDQQQWANAFGLSYFPPAAAPELSPAYQLYEWYHGEPPPAPELLFLIYPQVVVFFSALSYAGPDLTPETFRDGMFASPPTPRAITQPSVSYGTGVWDPEIHGDDYDGIDDMVELWWDPEAVVVDETGEAGQGAYRYVDGGQRYYADEYTDEVRVFDPDGAVAEIVEPPPEEIPPDYPPPR